MLVCTIEQMRLHQQLQIRLYMSPDKLLSQRALNSKTQRTRYVQNTCVQHCSACQTLPFVTMRHTLAHIHVSHQKPANLFNIACFLCPAASICHLHRIETPTAEQLPSVFSESAPGILFIVSDLADGRLAATL